MGNAMKRFFFHIREDGVLLRDREGVLCADAEQACTGAREAMREFILDTARAAVRCPVQLEVTDEEGAVFASYSSDDPDMLSPGKAGRTKGTH